MLFLTGALGLVPVAGPAAAVAASLQAPAGSGGGQEALWQLEELDTSTLDQAVEALDADVRRLLPTLDVRRMLADPGAGAGLDVGRMGRELGAYLLREVVFHARLLGQLLILVVVGSVLQQLSPAGGGGRVDEIAFLMVFLALSYLGLQSFREVVAIVGSSVEQMTGLMFALLPLLATLVAAAGGVTSAGLFHPLLITTVTGVAAVMQRWILPLLVIAAVLSVAAHFSRGFPVSRLAGLARQAVTVGLGLVFTVFIGVMAVRGVVGPVADGVALRTAKFLTGNFVPVVGRMMSDAVEVVMGGSLVIKSGVGAFGLLALLLAVTVPVLKIVAILAVYKVVTALMQPLCDERLVGALEGIGSSVALAMVSLATVGIMFFISIMVLVGAGNLAVMLR
ncbi:stage III sporulation protein AE [Limnochorda pilosa]|uniref:Stage III sporulation protein AE n=1 Tax=Limnochorda pilosa TaxID=1555112 RepID=A0A0K2SMS7_LIMPI|nr:stage III sporulation protein AE [Limnochorda pilosa]BAS28433.1 stage III sporulation protein AE [Limnochorda pilosa]